MSSSMFSPMIPMAVDQAERLILGLARELVAGEWADGTEEVGLEDCSGRVLAEAIASPLDFPHWDNSAMDGYAVRYGDVAQAGPLEPVVLTVVEAIAAGQVPQRRLESGQAARIFTGAMLPAGADTIVIQERTLGLAGANREGGAGGAALGVGQVQILAAPTQVGEFVRRRGEFHRAGQPLLSPGMRVGAAELAVLAAAQVERLRVYRRLRVAILSTGDELVTVAQALQQGLLPGQIVDSNFYALRALVNALGATVVEFGIVRDEPTAMRQVLEQAIASADVVVSSGGVSVGEYDYVDRLLQALGGTLHIRAVAMKPGKPLTVATVGARGQCLYFGLPGNPVSALVSFWRLVRPALVCRSGQTQASSLCWLRARSRQPLRSDAQRETYVWGHLTWVVQASGEGDWEFMLAGGSGSSGNLINLAGTNGLACVPAGRAIAAGESVQVLGLEGMG